MRQERIIQASLLEIFATHEIGRELKEISGWLDQHRPLLRLVSNDLRRDGLHETARRGLPAEAVLQKTISAITAASWEAINQAVVRNARQTKLEPAAMVRIDSTVTEALTHEPSGIAPPSWTVDGLGRLRGHGRFLGSLLLIVDGRLVSNR